MNRSILIVGAGTLSMVAGLLVAQQQSERQGRGQRGRFDYRRSMLILPSGMAAQMKERLKTDEAQNQTIEALAKEFDKKFLSLQSEFAEQCAQSLTPEQREVFKRMVEDQNRYRSESRRGPRMENDPRIFRYVARRLEFTEQQNAQMDVLLQAHEENVKAVGENEEAVKLLNEQTSNQIRALMTPEQQERLEEMRQRRDQSRGRGRNSQ